MKITALDNVTCADLGLDPHEDAHQTGDIGVDLQEHFDHHSAAMMLSEEDWHAIHDALRTAWRRGIAFALDERNRRRMDNSRRATDDEASHYSVRGERMANEKRPGIAHYIRGENWLFTVWPSGRVEISAGQRKDDKVIALGPDDVRGIFAPAFSHRDAPPPNQQ